MAKADLVVVDDDKVRAAVQQAQDAVDMAMAGNELAIRRAIEAGELLRLKKAEVGHGNFQDWLANTNLGTSERNARRWMRLAERVALIGDRIEDAHTLRQAYQLVGLLPEPEESPKSDPAKNSQSLTLLTRSLTHLRTELTARPIEQWHADERRNLRDRLAPLVAIYESLT